MPWHEFMAVAYADCSPRQYMRLLGGTRSGVARLSDDMCWYLDDTLRWIPTRNPESEHDWTGVGLNHYGPTVVEAPGARIAQEVFDGWAALFALGPERFSLIQGWNRRAAKGETRVAQVEIVRDEVVSALRRIARMAEQVGYGDHFLLHLGI